MQDTDQLGPDASRETSGGVWPYVGVGCMTTVVGFFGSGMIAILVAKLVGSARGCAVEAETGAPCDWFTYAIRGHDPAPHIHHLADAEGTRRFPELRLRGYRSGSR
jgi:hypothetical protein